jgi:hypothetical protein
MRALPSAACGLFLALGLAIARAAPADGTEWPFFRGAAASGVAGDTSNAHIAWSWNQRGSYIMTPLAYEGLLYVLSNQGLERAARGCARYSVIALVPAASLTAFNPVSTARSGRSIPTLAVNAPNEYTGGWNRPPRTRRE